MEQLKEPDLRLRYSHLPGERPEPDMEGFDVALEMPITEKPIPTPEGQAFIDGQVATLPPYIRKYEGSAISGGHWTDVLVSGAERVRSAAAFIARVIPAQGKMARTKNPDGSYMRAPGEYNEEPLVPRYTTSREKGLEPPGGKKFFSDLFKF